MEHEVCKEIYLGHMAKTVRQKDKSDYIYNWFIINRDDHSGTWLFPADT